LKEFERNRLKQQREYVRIKEKEGREVC